MKENSFNKKKKEKLALNEKEKKYFDKKKIFLEA